MWRYLKLHEAFMREALAGEHGELSLGELEAFHERQLRYLQHERLVHLIVTLFVATFLLLCIGFAAVQPSWPAAAAAGLLLLLTVGYLQHYFRLENGVQRLYQLTNRITVSRGVVSRVYDDQPPASGA